MFWKDRQVSAMDRQVMRARCSSLPLALRGTSVLSSVTAWLSGSGVHLALNSRLHCVCRCKDEALPRHAPLASRLTACPR